MEFVKIGILNERGEFGLARVIFPGDNMREAYLIVSGDLEALRGAQYLDPDMEAGGAFSLRARFPGTQQGLEDSFKCFEALSKRGPGRPKGSKSKRNN